MSLTYRSSVLFSYPPTNTISRMQIESTLYPHKRKLYINHRSSQCQIGNYKVEKLSARQARTIQNLSKSTRKYSLNQLVKTYNNGFKAENQPLQTNKNSRNSSASSVIRRNYSQKLNYFTIENNQQLRQNYETEESKQFENFLCPKKLKLFKAGLNYRSKERAKGAGVKKINLEDLKTYFNRSPQEQVDFTLAKKNENDKRFKTIDALSKQGSTHSSFKFNRLSSYKSNL